MDRPQKKNSLKKMKSGNRGNRDREEKNIHAVVRTSQGKVRPQKRECSSKRKTGGGEQSRQPSTVSHLGENVVGVGAPEM